MNKEKTRLTQEDYSTLATALQIAFKEIANGKDSITFQPLLENMSDLYNYFNAKTQDKWTK